MSSVNSKNKRAPPEQSSSKDALEQLRPYSLEAPPWRPLLHPSCQALGAPDLYPTRAGQPEDDLSQATVRSGIPGKAAVTNETFSAHDMIYDRLKAQTMLPQLASWMSEVLQRRKEMRTNRVAKSQHRIPPRVTLNDFKLMAYVKDLADPEVPLHRLAKSVPHGFRGEKMFEMLWSGGAASTAAANMNAANFPSPRIGASKVETPQGKSVELSRAVWFIRTAGAAEIQSSRNKSSFNYRAELTSALSSWLSKQLSELGVVPTSGEIGGIASGGQQRSGAVVGRVFNNMSNTRSAAANPTPVFINTTNAKDSCATLQNQDMRERWTNKWAYSITLARQLKAQDLLDKGVLAKWALDSLASMSPAQTWFVVEMVHEFLQDEGPKRPFSHHLAQVVCCKLKALKGEANRRALRELERRLILILRSAFDLDWESFVRPRLWFDHGDLIDQVLKADLRDQQPEVALRLGKAKARSRALLFLDKPLEGNSGDAFDRSFLDSEYADVHALDAQNTVCDRASLACRLGIASESNPYDVPSLPSKRPIADKLDTLLIWACSSKRRRPHRQYLAAAMLQSLSAKQSLERLPKGHFSVRSPASFKLESFLLRWLNDVDVAASEKAFPAEEKRTPGSCRSRMECLAMVELSSVNLLFGELCRKRLFSYNKYLQWLIARGLTGAASHPSAVCRSTTEKGSRSRYGSVHMRLLRSLPTYNHSPTLLQQRRLAIYGVRDKESWEEAAERRALRELKQALPWLFEIQDKEEDSANGDSREPDFDVSLSHMWTASRFVRVRILRECVLPRMQALAPKLDEKKFIWVATIMVRAQDFDSLSELVFCLLSTSLNNACLDSVISCVVEHYDTWKALGTFESMRLQMEQMKSSSIERGDLELGRSISRAFRYLNQVLAIEGSSVTADHTPILASGVGRQETALESARKIAASRHTQEISRARVIFRESLELLCHCSAPPKPEVLFEKLNSIVLDPSVEFDQDFRLWLDSRPSGGHRKHSVPSTLSAGFLQFLLACIVEGHLDAALVVDRIILPRTFDIASTGSDLSGDDAMDVLHQLPLLTGFLSVLFLDRNSKILTLDPKHRYRLGAVRRVLFNPVGYEITVRLVAHLTIIEKNLRDGENTASPYSSPDVSEVRDLIVASELFRACSVLRTRTLFDILSQSTQAIWGCDAHSVYDTVVGSLDAASLLNVSVLEVDVERIANRLNPWHASFTACELELVIERFQCLEPSSQLLAEAKLKAIATGLYDLLFLHQPSLGAQLLQSHKGSAMIGKIVDVGLDKLWQSFSRQGFDFKFPLAESLKEHPAARMYSASLREILRSSTSFTLPSTNVESASKLLEAACEQLELAGASLEDHGSSRPIAFWIRLLHLLFRLDSVWSAKSKSTIQRLISVLLSLCGLMGTKSEHEGLFSLLLDTTVFLLDELPAGMRAHNILDPGSKLSDHLLPEGNRMRILSVHSLLHQLSQDTSGDIVLGPNTELAVAHGYFSPSQPEPWECLEYIESQNTPGIATPLQSLAGSGKGLEPGEDPGLSILPKLQNLGSLSLSTFGIRMTGDPVPAPVSAPPTVEQAATEDDSLTGSQDMKSGVEESIQPWQRLESERSYGELAGGDPIYARDLRKGLTGDCDAQQELRHETPKGGIRVRASNPTATTTTMTTMTAQTQSRRNAIMIDLTDDGDEPIQVSDSAASTTMMETWPSTERRKDSNTNGSSGKRSKKRKDLGDSLTKGSEMEQPVTKKTASSSASKVRP
ncbi:hypothetical protein IE53DRAFT_367728 [Violaceomyces palustris]|uniref:Uncharacterized protein n=1 Tax=Violaceomyces palustris TaxID=1673888 RepID=A0ACD0P180_9BASI|nr:hypothetical protein IE53DRAFT_367728 [Violaceomyces palustris]